MLPFDSIGGRFIVGRDRLPPWSRSDVLARSGCSIRDISGMPACVVELNDLRIEELSLTLAAQKAALNLDTKRWYEGITAKQVYRVTLASGIRFLSVFCVVDCWRSFLFLDPDPDDAASKEASLGEAADRWNAINDRKARNISA